MPPRFSRVGLVAALAACGTTPPPPAPESRANEIALRTSPGTSPTAAVALAEALQPPAEMPPETGPPPDWPAELPFVSGTTISETTRSPGGDLLVEQHAGESAPTLIERLDKALMAAGWTRGEEHQHQQRRAIAWRTAEGRLAWLDIESAEETSYLSWQLWPLSHQPLAKLPGACVAVPEVTRKITVYSTGIDQRGDLRSGEVRWELTAMPRIDLDGDGRRDVLVPHPTAGDCPWEVPHAVYLLRDGCGHHVGTITGFTMGETRSAPMVNGLREIHTEATWAVHEGPRPEPQHHRRRRTFRFDGRTLRLTSDRDDVGICHHCGVSDCRST